MRAVLIPREAPRYSGVYIVPPRRQDPLQERAARLWPDSARNQAEWLRAVRVVRSTANGWLLERPAQRVGA